MHVDGLTRENVASHLQKYRLQLKKENKLDDDGNLIGGASGGPLSSNDPDELEVLYSTPGSSAAGDSNLPLLAEMPFLPTACAVSTCDRA